MCSSSQFRTSRDVPSRWDFFPDTQRCKLQSCSGGGFVIRCAMGLANLPLLRLHRTFCMGFTPLSFRDFFPHRLARKRVFSGLEAPAFNVPRSGRLVWCPHYVSNNVSRLLCTGWKVLFNVSLYSGWDRNALRLRRRQACRYNEPLLLRPSRSVLGPLC